MKLALLLLCLPLWGQDTGCMVCTTGRTMADPGICTPCGGTGQVVHNDPPINLIGRTWGPRDFTDPQVSPHVSGGVRVKATPEPMVVLQSLGMRSLGLWTLAICNDSPQSVTLSRERLILAFPPDSGLRVVSSERAKEALEYAQRRTWKARMASVMRYGLMGSTAGTALAGTQKNVVSGLALGAVLADQVARRLENEIPRLDPWLAGLSDDPLILGPGQCGSRTVFAALQKEAHVLEVTVP